MQKQTTILSIQVKYQQIKLALDEKHRRIWCATEAKALGRGGMSIVHEATGVSLPTIRRGLLEIENPEFLKSKNQRKEGGGRKKLLEKDPKIKQTLHDLVEPTSRGDPMSPLRWTSKSTRKLAKQLKVQ